MSTDVLAVVGSVDFGYGGEAAAVVYELVVDEIAERRPDLVISGGAPGVDTISVQAAKDLGVPTAEFHPRRRVWAGPDGFRARNIKVGDVCTRAMRISCVDTRTYGSGWTVDRIEKLGKPVRRIVIHRDGLVVDSGWKTPNPTTLQETLL